MVIPPVVFLIIAQIPQFVNVRSPFFGTSCAFGYCIPAVAYDTMNSWETRNQQEGDANK
jgi:hypothetical protein